MNFYEALKENNHYTDYQMKVVHYALITIASEISKFFILGAFFAALGRMDEYLWAMLLFLGLRRYSGGFHSRTYFGCLAVSFCYLSACVIWLPSLTVPLYLQKLLMISAMAVLAVLSPLPSIYHASLKRSQKIGYKVCVLLFAGVYFSLVSQLDQNSYYRIGFWVILMHTVQLVIYYVQRRFINEKIMEKQNA